MQCLEAAGIFKLVVLGCGVNPALLALASEIPAIGPRWNEVVCEEGAVTSSFQTAVVAIRARAQGEDEGENWESPRQGLHPSRRSK